MEHKKEPIDLFKSEDKKIRAKKMMRLRLRIICMVMVFIFGFAVNEAYGEKIDEKLKNTQFDWLFEKNDQNEKDENGSEKPNEENKNKYTLENIYSFDYTLVKSGEKAIIPLDLSLFEYGADYIYNDTSYRPNTEALKVAPRLSGPEGEEPLVLILHTHATEGFCPEDTYSYSNGYNFARSENTNENVVAVGREMARIFNENGIKTLHCEILHDKESYKDSYIRSNETVREYLKKYPSIKYVFDLHRDSVSKSNGELVRPVTAVDGEAVAQIMCVVGTGENNGHDFDWQNNLSLAINLRERLNSKYTNLVRGTCLRPSAYNQHLAPVYMLFEIGASGNTLAEAQNAVRLLTNEIADMINDS